MNEAYILKEGQVRDEPTCDETVMKNTSEKTGLRRHSSAKCTMTHTWLAPGPSPAGVRMESESSTSRMALAVALRTIALAVARALA
jgi:hypothetical protein